MCQITIYPLPNKLWNFSYSLGTQRISNSISIFQMQRLFLWVRLPTKCRSLSLINVTSFHNRGRSFSQTTRCCLSRFLGSFWKLRRQSRQEQLFVLCPTLSRALSRCRLFVKLFCGDRSSTCGTFFLHFSWWWIWICTQSPCLSTYSCFSTSSSC